MQEIDNKSYFEMSVEHYTRRKDPEVQRLIEEYKNLNFVEAAIERSPRRSPTKRLIGKVFQISNTLP